MQVFKLCSTLAFFVSTVPGCVPISAVESYYELLRALYYVL